jgi:hypothetical protein
MSDTETIAKYIYHPEIIAELCVEQTGRMVGIQLNPNSSESRPVWIQLNGYHTNRARLTRVWIQLNAYHTNRARLTRVWT